MEHQTLSCDGTDPEEIHKEPGFACSASSSDAKIIAICFKQSAYFWFDGAAFWLMPALVRASPLQLPQST
jgi:hypothetical protein